MILVTPFLIGKIIFSAGYPIIDHEKEFYRPGSNHYLLTAVHPTVGPESGYAQPSSPRRRFRLFAGRFIAGQGLLPQLVLVTDSVRSNRLVTLTGPGDTGKTRLGLLVAAAVVENYADGVFFVPLLTASHEAQVPKTIAQVLGLVERPTNS